MRVFVTGATGFTGSRVVPLLLQNGYEVRCLYRPTSDRSRLPQPAVEWVLGDVSNPQGLATALTGTQALVNLASLGFGHAESIVHAAQTAGVQRAVFISTTAIFTQLNARSKAVRLAAEQAIETSGLQYTLLRPTMIYGGPRDRNMWRLIRWLRILPLVPIFGDGGRLQQPIHVDDVAAAVLGALRTEAAIGRSYNLAGQEPLTYNQVIDTIARALRRRAWKLHIPAGPVVALLSFFERLPLPLPIKAEQVLRLNEDKAFSYAEAQHDFGFSPLSFAEGIARALQSPD